MKSTIYVELFRASTKKEAQAELENSPKSQYDGCVIERRKIGGKIYWCIFYTTYK